MGYYGRSSCMDTASDDRYFPFVLVFVPLVTRVPLYRDPIAADDRRSLGAPSGCGFNYGRGDQTDGRLCDFFCCSAGLVAMDVYPGTTFAVSLPAAAPQPTNGPARG